MLRSDKEQASSDEMPSEESSHIVALCRNHINERKALWLGTLAFDRVRTKLHSFDGNSLCFYSTV